jgi:transposase
MEGFFCWCVFTFHAWARFIKSLFREMTMTIHTLFIIIKKKEFFLCLLTFSAIATKYSLKVSAIFKSVWL